MPNGLTKCLLGYKMCILASVVEGRKVYTIQFVNSLADHPLNLPLTVLHSPVTYSVR